MPRMRGARLAIIAILGLVLLVSPGLAVKQTEASDRTAGSVSTIAAKLLDDLRSVPVVAASAPKPRVFAKSYLLMDGESTTVLASKNTSLSVPIASTTKMMTAIVARQLYRLDEVVTVPAEIRQVPGSDIDLVIGEKITVHELLKGLLIQSGNDAAFALAYHLSPSGDDVSEQGASKTAVSADYEPFVEEMNIQAASLHLTNTHYGDPAGLDDDDGRSTALDLAHTARLLMKDPVLAKIVATPSATITSVDGKYSHELKNSNRLIISEESYYLPQVTGIKTGFTPAAGHCLVSAYVKDGRTLIGVVLNTDEYTITASASEMKKLFGWAEQNVQQYEY